MVAFGEQTFRLLNEEARARGITVQELMRAVIIPDWFKTRYETNTVQNLDLLRKTATSQQQTSDPVVPYSYSNKLRY
jgi:hypothetical protein